MTRRCRDVVENLPGGVHDQARQGGVLEISQGGKTPKSPDKYRPAQREQPGVRQDSRERSGCRGLPGPEGPVEPDDHWSPVLSGG